MDYFNKINPFSELLPHSHFNTPFLLEKLLFKMSKKWIAGYNIDDALSYGLTANKRGLKCIINYLGEDFKNPEIVKNTVREYSKLINKMSSKNVLGSVSIKPTQIGLSIDFTYCLNNLLEIISVAKKNHIFIWIDMESFETVKPTLSIYQKVFEETNEIGIVLQSYLKRSYSDLTKLLKYDANIRLVKGAYYENEENAYQRKSEIDNNYLEMVKLLFLQIKNIRQNQIFAIATHDSNIIERSLHLFSLSDLKKEHLLFQFLKGIREKLKINLLDRGFTVEEYIPYGENWLPYSLRRLRERKSNILLLMRSLISS
ncbi:MAG TPA: proline dehydrogenase family protein [Nitrososphaeraceae archaeon]|nr:proline dehydrogenase family protein [Nitrososphaeraceae archaeon]